MSGIFVDIYDFSVDVLCFMSSYNKSFGSNSSRKRTYPDKEEECMEVIEVTTEKGIEHFMVPVGCVGKYTLYLRFRDQQEWEGSGLATDHLLEE